MKNLIKIWKESFYLLRQNKKVLIPFVFLGVFNLIMLYVIYLFPQRPVYYVLAPIVAKFSGSQSLQYPVNLLKLPRFFNYALVFSSSTVGLIMTALAIRMIAAGYGKKQVLIFKNLLTAAKRFFALLTVWAIMFIMVFLAKKILMKVALPSSLWWVAPYLLYCFSLILQMMFIYIMPAFIISKMSLIKGFAQGIKIFLKKWLITFFIVFIPSVFYFLIIALKQNSIFLMDIFMPEVIVLILGFGVAATVLIDIMITVPMVLVYLENKEV